MSCDEANCSREPPPPDRIFADVPSTVHALARPLLPLALLLSWTVLAVALAFAPYDRGDWALENILSGLLVLVLCLSRRRFPFSGLSYVLMFVFLALHVVGAHYTYSKVPYDAWCEALFGRTLSSVFGFERNHFDRLVHFLYGFLLSYPMREVFVRVAGVRGFWGYFLPLLMTMASSCLYEIIEWVAAVVVGGDVGAAYLGTQGDEFDSQKDMALASLGAVLSLLVVAAIHKRVARDFQAEWAESLRVKRARPLGEVAIAERKTR
jgi:putative membrane protein